MNRPLSNDQELMLTPPEQDFSIKRAERRKSFNLTRSKLPALAVLLLLGYLVVSFGSQFSRLSVMQKDVQSIQQQVQELQQKNASLREELRMVQSDAYVEKTAREKLGLVKPGETRVVPVAPGTQLKRVEPPAKSNVITD